MDITKQNFWIRISELSEKYGLTQQKLSDDIGVGLPTFKNWKTRLLLPEINYIMKLADYFNVTVEYLMTGKNGPTLDDDLQEIIIELRKLSPEKRKPIIALIKGQVDYWLKNS